MLLVKGVRYLFTATDSQAADNPYQYVQFSDHQIDPTTSLFPYFLWK